MPNFITNILAYLTKNLNLIVGVLGSLSKVAVGIINIIQPGKDSLVDTIESITEKIQSVLFKLTSILTAFGK